MEQQTKKSAFTIVAKNYIGLAKVLEKSILKHDSDIDFYIFVADELPSSLGEQIPDNVIESKKVLSYSDEEWSNMTFKYTLTEFCTAIKPSCFQYLFNIIGYEKAVYFDPDIYVFDSLNVIYETIDNFSILVTPHIVFPVVGDNSDRVFLQSGPYNLGFLGLRNSEVSKNMLVWWRKKLLENCFDDVLDYTFTDQKWMLMIHSYFPQTEICVSRNIGLNVAPWNFRERKFVKTESGYEIECRNNSSISEKLVFIHYSGYDYKALLDGREIRPRVLEVDVDFADVKMMMDFYSNALRENENTMRSYLDLKYSYATYGNGVPVETFHRRLYRRVTEVDGAVFAKPYSTTEGSLYKRLEQKKLILKWNSSSADIVPNSSQVSNKLKSFNILMRYVFKLMGYHRYLMLLRLMKHFSRYESQIFLLDDKYMNNNLNLPNKLTI